MLTKALLAALGALAGFLLFGSAGALGAGAVLVNLFTPFPAALLGMRLGPPWGAATVGLTAVAVLATSGGAPTLLYLVQFGVPALLLPALMTRGVHWDRAAVATLALMLALGMIALLVAATGAGQSATAFIDAQIGKEIDQAVALMNDLAGSEQTPEEAAAFREMAAEMGAFMRRAYPGMLVAVGGALQLVTVGLLALAVRPAALPGPPFARWRSPEPLIWGVIAAGFAAVFAAGGMQSAAINVLIILLPVYFLQGLAVVEHLMQKKRLSPLLRGAGWVLLLVVNPLPLIVTGIGVFDLWVDFRKPRGTNE